VPAAVPTPSPEADTVAGIAAALREDPVLVHESMGNGRTDEVHESLGELVDDLADAGLPAYVALVQTPNVQLASRDSGDDLLRLIHAELDEPGLYVVSTPVGQTAVAAYDVPVDDVLVSLGRYRAMDEARSGLPEGDFVSTAGEAAALLTLATDDDYLLSAGEVDDLMASGPWLAEYGDEPMSYELDDAQGEPLTPLVVAVACGLTALVVGWRLLRARTALARERRGRLPAPVDDRTPQQAREAVADLRREVDRSIRLVPDEVHGCLEAAERLVESSSRLDVVGALVLAEQGSARLRGERLPLRCYFDPRHGPSARTATVSGVSLPACTRCAEALASGGEPDSLTVDRGDRPYWRDDSIWAETGFGSLDPDLWRLVTERTR